MVEMVRGDIKEYWGKLISKKESAMIAHTFLHILDEIEKIKKPRETKSSLPLRDFSDFFILLKPMQRLVAKLIYYGRGVSIQDVLDLRIQDVLPNEHMIVYANVGIIYDADVIKQCLVCIGDRKKGYLFVGRGNARLNRATICRSFKIAAKTAGISDDFTPGMLKK